VVIASNLLLVGALGISLDVRVEETTTVAHVLDGCARANGDFEGAVLANLGSLQVGLEERAHLGIARTGSVKDSKVESEGEQVDQERNDDETDNSGEKMGCQSRLSYLLVRSRHEWLEGKTNQGHLGVTKLVPEILNGVETNESGDEKTNKLDTADTADAETRHEQPKEPFRLEAVAALVVELGQTQDGGDSATEQHGVEQDETADGGVGVLAEDHEGDEPDGGAGELELAGRVVCHGDAHYTEEGVEDSHKGVVDLLGVLLSGLELEGSVVASENTRQADQHLSERWVDIEIVFVLDVVAAELAEAVGFQVSPWPFVSKGWSITY
jgi:hypothetical protein